MENQTFWELLAGILKLPFDIEDVKEIDTNGSNTWIDLFDGSSYFIMIEKCEPATTG